jgi:hypothetical protein
MIAALTTALLLIASINVNNTNKLVVKPASQRAVRQQLSKPASDNARDKAVPSVKPVNDGVIPGQSGSPESATSAAGKAGAQDLEKSSNTNDEEEIFVEIMGDPVN